MMEMNDGVDQPVLLLHCFSLFLFSHCILTTAESFSLSHQQIQKKGHTRHKRCSCSNDPSA